MLFERQGTTLVVTLNRPEARNAITPQMAEVISSELEEANADPEVRAVVITGSGGTFCAGGDMKELGSRVGGNGLPPTGFAGYTWHYLDKPTIAAVEGYALGGGMEVCLASDLVVAASDARLGLTEVKLGLIGGADGVQRLARQMPQKIAFDYLLTGRMMEASVAHQWGVVSRLAQPGEALADALELAETIAANGPLAVSATKRVAHAAFDHVWSEEIARHDYSEEQRVAILATADAKEGIAAFVEKRPPNWTGK